MSDFGVNWEATETAVRDFARMVVTFNQFLKKFGMSDGEALVCTTAYTRQWLDNLANSQKQG